MPVFPKVRNVLALFLVVFVILNLFQSFFTGIGNDEAYYWMYSRHLDWGYFDHPPMIAVLIATGYRIFANELGVRIFTVVLSALSIFLLWKLIDDKDKVDKRSEWVFVLLVAASPLLHIYGFVTTPDVPLIFFSVLFVYLYKQFLLRNTWLNTILLGLTMAAMAYSKYHGALLIFFTLLSNPRLLLNPKIYIAGIITLVLIIPHLLWQYNHNFATFEYHFFSRNENFNLEALLMYPVNVLLILNPFITPLLFFKIFKLPSKNAFERTLKFIFWGFILFFGVSAFKSHVEPHWIAIVIVPATYFLFKAFQQSNYKYLKATALFSFGLLFIARLALMLPLGIKSEFHGGKKWAMQYAEFAGDKAIGFTDSFQSPSKYNFYTGKDAFCYSSIRYRPTQYDFWNYEEKYGGKEVIIVPNYKIDGMAVHVFPNGSACTYKDYSSFEFLDKLHIDYTDTLKRLANKKEVSVELLLTNPYDNDVVTQGDEPLSVVVSFKKDTHIKGIFDVNEVLPDTLFAHETIAFPVTFSADLPPATYLIGFSFRNTILAPFISSKMKKVDVTP